jgi:hypothetical protein
MANVISTWPTEITLSAEIRPVITIDSAFAAINNAKKRVLCAAPSG